MTPLTRAQIAAIGTRPGRGIDQFVPLTVAERDALVKLAQGLIALGPEIEADLKLWDEVRVETSQIGQKPGTTERLLRQVRALTEGEG